MKPVGKPDAGKLHVRFDERGGETERAKAPPRLSSTLLKRQKNDMADAEAICEAVTRANMRFVPTKTSEQQSCLMLHRTRHLFIRQQTAVINSIRAHVAECQSAFKFDPVSASNFDPFERRTAAGPAGLHI
jgi:transposase